MNPRFIVPHTTDNDAYPVVALHPGFGGTRVGGDAATRGAVRSYIQVAGGGAPAIRAGARVRQHGRGVIENKHSTDDVYIRLTFQVERSNPK